METANIIFFIIGVLISVIGIGTFFNSNLVRLINLPGPHILKAIVTTIIGVIIIIISFIT